jgi:hypothetical protein
MSREAIFIAALAYFAGPIAVLLLIVCGAFTN